MNTKKARSSNSRTSVAGSKTTGAAECVMYDDYIKYKDLIGEPYRLIRAQSKERRRPYPAGARALWAGPKGGQPDIC